MKTVTKGQPKKVAVIMIKTDHATKRAFQRYATSVHLPLSTMLVASGRQTIRQGSLTHVPTYTMSAALETDLAEIEDDIKHGRNIGATASTNEEIDALFTKIRRGDYAD